MLSSRGEKILMVDADGATKFSDLDKVEKALDELQGGKEDMAVSVGSRAHLQDDAVAQVRIPFILIFIATEAHFSCTIVYSSFYSTSYTSQYLYTPFISLKLP